MTTSCVLWCYISYIISITEYCMELSGLDKWFQLHTIHYITGVFNVGLNRVCNIKVFHVLRIEVIYIKIKQTRISTDDAAICFLCQHICLISILTDFSPVTPCGVIDLSAVSLDICLSAIRYQDIQWWNIMAYCWSDRWEQTSDVYVIFCIREYAFEHAVYLCVVWMTVIDVFSKFLGGK